MASAPLLAGVSALAIVGPPAGAAAANSVDAASTTVPELVVTAEKREEAINRVPMSIAAVGGEQLERQGVIRLSDLQKIVPDFSSSMSISETPIYTLRGVGFVDNSMGGRPTVSVYADQFPVPFTIETTGGNLDLAQIEVLKGPQGTLFGQNSTAGAINLIAAKPSQTFEAGAAAGYGNYNDYSIEGYASGPISSILGVRVAARHDGGEGWQKSITQPGLTMGATDLTDGRVIVDWRPTGPLKIELNVNGFLDRSESPAPQMFYVLPASAAVIPALASYPLAPPNDTAADWNNESYRRDNTFVQANLRADYELPGGFVFTSLSSYSRYKEHQNIDTDGTTLSDLQQLTLGSIRSWYQEARIAGHIADRAYVVVGGDYSNDKSRETDYLDLADGTEGLLFLPLGLPLFKDGRNISNQDSYSYAVFGNVDYDITSQLRFEAGARYTRAVDHFNGCTADSGDGNAAADFGGFENFIRANVLGLPPNPPIPPGSCVTADATFTPALVVSTLDEDNVSWRAGLDWTLRPGTMLYANVSRGFKAGGYPELGATETSQFDPATQEELTAYEAGFKVSLLDTLQLNGAAFYYDYKDKQVLGTVSDPVFGTLLKLINVPNSRIIGAEIETVWIPVTGLTLRGNATYINSEILDNFTNYNIFGQQQDFGGEPYPNTPQWQLVGGASYRRPISDTLEGFADVDVSYKSATNSGLGESALEAIKGYTLVDLDAGLETRNHEWRASIWARNIANTYYWTGAYLGIDTAVRYTGMPRTVGVRVEYRFGGGGGGG